MLYRLYQNCINLWFWKSSQEKDLREKHSQMPPPAPSKTVEETLSEAVCVPTDGC